MTIRVVGLDALLARLRRVDSTAGIAATLRPAQDKAAKLIEDGARSRAQSRQMARSVRGNRYTVRPMGVEVTVGGGSDGDWAVGAQYGSSRYRQFPGRRQPLGYTVGPAIESAEPLIGELYAEEITSIFP